MNRSGPGTMTSEGAPRRRRLTTLDKLRIVVAQARCPDCGEKLGALENIEFDHPHPLGLNGADDLENRVARHKACHARKTRGHKGTTYGSDIHAIAKTKRLEEARLEAEAEPPRDLVYSRRREKQKIPSRPFPKRKDK